MELKVIANIFCLAVFSWLNSCFYNSTFSAQCNSKNFTRWDGQLIWAYASRRVLWGYTIHTPGSFLVHAPCTVFQGINTLNTFSKVGDQKFYEKRKGVCGVLRSGEDLKKQGLRRENAFEIRLRIRRSKIYLHERRLKIELNRFNFSCRKFFDEVELSQLNAFLS